ncbi:MAG: glutaredoxin family protein [Betaproteobacteria bacterium]|nr:glutaredoxin family protein [Betaproteobacteria bacterium]MDE2056076.1 glutaredoxin family protein [Betaproteobacteria bacterium]
MIRQGCHLCDEMKAALSVYLSSNQFSIELVDIDNNNYYHQLFFDKIPVLLLNEKIICESFFDSHRFEESLTY